MARALLSPPLGITAASRGHRVCAGIRVSCTNSITNLHGADSIAFLNGEQHACLIFLPHQLTPMYGVHVKHFYQKPSAICHSPIDKLLYFPCPKSMCLLLSPYESSFNSLSLSPSLHLPLWLGTESVAESKRISALVTTKAEDRLEYLVGAGVLRLRSEDIRV